MKRKIEKNNKAEAITQILILVIATFAISWMIGSEVKEVSAASDTCVSTPAAFFCVSKFCYDNKVYGGKRANALSQVCERDPNNCLEKCQYGCSNGACKLQPISGSGDWITKAAAITQMGSTVKNILSKDQKADVKQVVADAAGNTAKNVVTNTATNTITSVLTKAKATDIFNAAYDKAMLQNLGKDLATESAKNAVKNAAYDAAIKKGLSTDAANALAKSELEALGDVAKIKTYSLSEFLFGNMNGIEGWTGVGGSSTVGAVGAIVVWAAVAFVIGRYVGEWAGLSVHNSQVLGYALAAGTIAGLVATSEAILGASAVGGPVGLLIGAAVALVVFALFAKKSSADIIQYNCYLWDSKSGAGLTPTQMTQRCRLCNSQKDFACAEYQCRSLGQGCMLINQDEATGKQLCIWNNTNDILAPVILPWKEALLEDFAYTPDPTVVIPDKGVKITYTGAERVTKDGTTRCAPPYTKISFGVELDEPAKCKISPLRLKNYSIMADVFMGDGIRDYNHSFSLRMPSQGALEAENYTVDNGGKYQFFVRCQDSKGNTNVGTFVFKFCISEGDDITAPKIEGTSLLDNSPLSYGQKFTDIELYVNEPANCRWSHTDRSYETMEQNLTCANNLSEMNAQMLYTCRGNLTGIKDGQDNTFYFRCKDQPYLNATEQNKRNANTQSYRLTLIGTEPLAIVHLGPTGTIKGPTSTVVVNLTVETERGYDEGKAICAFSETGTSGSYIDFFYGYDAEPFTQTMHSQELGLTAQNYTYFIKCRDKGGNTDDANVSFQVQVDISPPIVVRVYKEDEYLKIITDEAGKCVYSNSGCDYLFSQGTEMTSLDETEHYVEWDISKDFYIKCQDVYQKGPLPKECSLIARPFKIFELQ